MLICDIAVIMVLIGMFDQKSNFRPQLAWSSPYKSRIGPKREKKEISRAESNVT